MEDPFGAGPLNYELRREQSGTAGGIQVYGVDARFWEFHGTDAEGRAPERGAVRRRRRAWRARLALLGALRAADRRDAAGAVRVLDREGPVAGRRGREGADARSLAS